MSFHPEKCQLLRVSKKKKKIITNYFIHGKSLTQTNNAKYLGVIINNNLIKTCCNPQINIGTKTLSLIHMQGQKRTNTLSTRVALEHGMSCLIRPGKPIT